MEGIIRKDLTNQIVHVEYRSSVNRYFVVYPDLLLEVAIGFEHKFAAAEIAKNTVAGTPFYTLIPCVAYGTPYPRPWLDYPSVSCIEIPLRFM